MSVLRKYNQTTQQWEILQGGVQGLQGPPNVLSKGTVTTTPPGTSADFTVTGAPPNQKLNLTVPRGDVGPAGGPIPTGGTPGQFPTPDGAGGYVWSDIAATLAGYHKVGPGDPRIPVSTGGVIDDTEPNGCTYVSTDSGIGGFRWVKRGNMWICEIGDTGFRDVSNLLVPGAVDSTRTNILRIRRTQAGIHVYFHLFPVAAQGAVLFAYPDGFRPSGVASTVVGASETTPYRPALFTGGVEVRGWGYQPYPEGSTVKFSGQGLLPPINNSWPITLPGTPA